MKYEEIKETKLILTEIESQWLLTVLEELPADFHETSWNRTREDFLVALRKCC